MTRHRKPPVVLHHRLVNIPGVVLTLFFVGMAGFEPATPCSQSRSVDHYRTFRFARVGFVCPSPTYDLAPWREPGPSVLPWHGSLSIVDAGGSNPVGYQPNRPPLREAAIHPRRLVRPSCYQSQIVLLRVDSATNHVEHRGVGPRSDTLPLWALRTVETIVSLVAYRCKIPGLC